MEIKELVPKLVEHYERCIDEMPEVGWYGYLFTTGVSCGICALASVEFDTFIYGSEFVKQFTSNEPWVCLTPSEAKSYSEAKELLQIRLNRLKDFL